jgi:TonB family protein
MTATRLIQGLVALSALVVLGDAAAEWRCDCTSIIASCRASAVAHESFVEVTSDVSQCARVDYLVDGIPFVALVVDGSERQDWIAQSASPDIIVQSCQVCLDNSSAADSNAASVSAQGASSPTGAEPTRLISVDPLYPPAAMADGIEGHVDVRFTLSPSGTVVAPQVVAAEPAGVFDQAAIAAVSRWRYSQPANGEEPMITERVDFDLSDAILALARPARSANAAPAATRTTNNDCVREQTRYDFGSRVDISLINACNAPLLVYTCAAGTAGYRDRWVCRGPQQSATVVGATAGSSLASSVLADSGALARNERLEISRAPNGEYWWLACAVDDASCRAAGEQWIRATDRQTASLDPQDRSRLRLGRSY